MVLGPMARQLCGRAIEWGWMGLAVCELNCHTTELRQRTKNDQKGNEGN